MEIKASESIKKEKQSITTLFFTQQSYLVNVLAALPFRKCWKQIKTTSLSFTAHWILIILIKMFHQVHHAKCTEKTCTDLQLEGLRISIIVKNCLIFMKCDKETIGRVLIACMMLGFYQTICQENGFLTKSL